MPACWSGSVPMRAAWTGLTTSIWDDMMIAPRWQRIELNDPSVLPPGKLLEMATIDGAKHRGPRSRHRLAGDR